MRRVLCLFAILLAAIGATAQRGQDFASRFMQKFDGDTAVQCVTVSPKMMEQLTKQADTDHNERIAQAIEKLKSARIVTASTNGEGYYQKAEDLLKRNPRRFRHYKSYRTDHSHGAFYTRKLKGGDTVELIMLHTSDKTQRMVIVNLTGDIDDEFINSLTKTLKGQTAKASHQKDISKLSL